MEDYPNSFLFSKDTETQRDAYPSKNQNYQKSQTSKLHVSLGPGEREDDQETNSYYEIRTGVNNPLIKSQTKPQEYEISHVKSQQIHKNYPQFESIFMPQNEFQNIPNPYLPSTLNQSQNQSQYGGERSRAIQRSSVVGDSESKQFKEIQKMIDQINEGSKKINSLNGNSAMLIGNTGAGKTTLSAYLSGQEIVSAEDENEDTYYLYKNQSHGLGIIGHSNTKSETTIPNKFGEEFWDCPGFQDSNGVDSDIVNAFFLKKIADRSDGVKFILVMEGKQLEGRGVGDCRGAAFKRLLETLVSLQSKTGLKLKNHLLIVLTKVSPSKKISYYKNKLEQFFLDAYKENKFDVENQVAEDFFLTLNEVPLELFPIVDQDPGTSVPQTFRQNILRSLSQINYTKNKINYPLSKECLVRIKDIMRFSLEKIKSEFISIIYTLQDAIIKQNQSVLRKVQENIDRISKSQSTLRLVNMECLAFFQSNIVQPFLLDQESDYIVRRNQENIEFYLREVLGGVLQISSSILNSIKLSDLESNLSTMNQIIKREIKQREDKEEFNKQLRIKDQQQIEMEGNYLLQNQEQIIEVEKLKEHIGHQKFLREVEIEEENEQRKQMQLENEQKFNFLQNRMESQLRKSERQQKDISQQKQVNENLLKSIHDLENKKILEVQEFQKTITLLESQWKEHAQNEVSQLQNKLEQNSRLQEDLKQTIFNQQREMEILREQFSQKSQVQKQNDHETFNKMMERIENIERESQNKLAAAQRELQEEKQKAEQNMIRYSQEMQRREESLRSKVQSNDLVKNFLGGFSMKNIIGGLLGGVSGIPGGAVGIITGALNGMKMGSKF